MKREKDETKVPCRGRMGDLELREREGPRARKGTATFLQGRKGSNRKQGRGREERHNMVMSFGWRRQLKGFMTSGLCFLCEVEPRAWFGVVTGEHGSG